MKSVLRKNIHISIEEEAKNYIQITAAADHITLKNNYGTEKK